MPEFSYRRALLPIVSLFLIALLAFSAGLIGLLVGVTDHRLAAQIGGSLSASAGLLCLLLSLLSALKRKSIQEFIQRVMREDTEAIASFSNSACWIALAAAVGLYFEMMMIRLDSCFFQLFAYYKNVTLMSCFLGLGIGYGLNRMLPMTTGFVLPLIAAEAVFMNILRWYDLSYILRNPAREQATLEIYAVHNLSETMISFGFVVLVFIWNALCCIPLGQLAARFMERRPNLAAYSWNLIGSLAGIAVFALICFLWLPPPVWLAVAVIGLLPFLRKSINSLFTGALAVIIAIGFLSIAPRAARFQPMKYDMYSPYQVLTVMLEHGWPRVFSNNTWLQSIVDLNPSLVKIRDDLKPIANYYDLPYRFQPSAEHVLIVGSGTGNDAAAAIRGGAKDIDAVEIDPGIIQIGSSCHPENPYQHANVHIINDDARHYIRHTNKKYNLIVYGLLDSSSTLTANSGGVRMDSYVWTVEGFREARARLQPGGIISCSVCILPELTPKVFQMLKAAFDGQIPTVYRTVWDSGYTFLAGDKVVHPDNVPFEDLTNDYVKKTTAVDLATDDWPFLWMFARSYPISYAAIITMLVVLSFFVIHSLLAATTSSFTARNFSWSCFFLGAGFMLVETKGMTELALVYGSTWFVTSIVIAAIITLALLANLLVIKKGSPSPVVAYGLLFLSLIGGFAMTQSSLSGLGPLMEPLVMTLILTLPLFFSGFAFSAELNRCPSIAAALASNLLGGMVGGFIEYNSLYLGYRSLYLFALAMYVLALVASLKVRAAKPLIEAQQSAPTL